MPTPRTADPIPRKRPPTRPFGAALLPLACSAVLALGAGLLAAPGVAAAADGRGHGPADSSWPSPPAKPAATGAAAAVEAARAAARSTGRPVTVDALTTASNLTRANPDGTLSTEHSPVAERVRGADGGWRPVDATLRAAPDGSITPTAVPSGLVFSGGGQGPMATMATADGKRLSVRAPFDLPRPVLDGDSALYESVLPDVDLRLSATRAGGWRQVLIVRTAQAAADPRVKKLHLDVTAEGLTVRSDAAGNLAATDAGGKARFTAPTPVMWDSTSVPTAPAAKTSGRSAASGEGPEPSSADAPGEHARVAPVAATTSGTGIDLVPDAGLLGQGTGPWYIDPGWNPSTDNGTQAWAQVQEAYPETREFNGTQHDQDKPAAGYCGYINGTPPCTLEGRTRAYFQIGLDPRIWGATVLGAKLHANVVGSSSPSTSTPMGVYSTGEAYNNPIDTWTRWKAQPCGTGSVMAGCDKVSGNWIAGTGGKEFDVTGIMAQAAEKHWGSWTFGFAPDDEYNRYYRQRFANNPHIVVTYDLTPHIGDPRTSPTPGFAGTGEYDACATRGTANPWDNPGWVGVNTDIVLSTDAWSPTGQQLWTAFKIWDDDAGGTSKLYETGWAASSGRVSASAGPLIDGHQYGWFAATTDGTLTSGNTPMCFLRVDRTPPTARVTSTDFPESGTIGAHPKKVGETGTITLGGTDPAPAGGGRSSGLACLRWTEDPVQAAATGWNCNDNAGSGNIVKLAGGQTSVPLTVTPKRWGTHFLYLQTQDNAGNMSQPVAYTYYVPSNPDGPAPIMGDIDGDRKADVLLPDGSGTLRLIGGGGDTYAAPNARTGSAPEGGSQQDGWQNVQLAHRGSFSGRNIDDLVAHRNGRPELYIYANDDIAGRLDGQAPYPVAKPEYCLLPDGTEVSCSEHGFGADWSAVTQIAAFGSPSGDTPDVLPGGLSLRMSSLLFVEDGRLWLAKSPGANRLAREAFLISGGSKGWRDYDLITPGPANGSDMPTVWARSRVDGTIHAYQLRRTESGFDASAFADPAGGRLGTLVVDPALYPRVGSDGDLTGDRIPDLWAVDTGRQLVAWAGSGVPLMVDTQGNPLPGRGATVTKFAPSPVVLGNLDRPIGNWLVAPDGSNNVPDGQGKANGTATGVDWVADTVGGRAATVGAFSPSRGSAITMSGPVVDVRRSFTVSTWVKPGTGGGVVASQDGAHGSNFMLYGGGPGENWNFAVAFADDNGWSYHRTGAYGPAAAIRHGVWTRLTASYDARTELMSLYVDGTLAASGHHAYSTGPAPTGPFVIGRYKYQGAPSSTFDGSVGSTAVYPFAVSPAGPDTAGRIHYRANQAVCVDDNGAGRDNGTAIQAFDCNDGPSQRFALGSDGSLRVMGGCVRPLNGGTTATTPVELWTCDGTAAQRWLPLANGALYHPASNRCLDLPNGDTTRGTRLWLYDCHFAASELWSVPALGTAVLPAPPRS